MFSHLNKSLNNKLIFSLKSCRVRCLNSKTSGHSGSDGIKSGQNEDKNRIQAKDNDFFGIFETNSKEISGLYDNSVDKNEVIDRYKDLVSSRESKMNDQNFLVTSFGRVRLDSDNIPKYHGQYDPDNRKTKFDIIEFEEKLNNKRKTSQQNDESIRNQSI